jgi:hypothetical protein
MRKTLLFVTTIFSMTACDGLVSDTLADGIAVVRHAKRVRPAAVYQVPHNGRRRLVVYRRPVCPDRFSCYSLYGAYGPYGGTVYWNRYTIDGWNRLN